LIAGSVLGGWLVPAVGAALPGGWSLMKASTALAVLLCTVGLALTQPTRSPRLLLAGRACACVAVCIALAALFEHWTGRSSLLGALLAADSSAQMPDRMSNQAASFLVVRGF
jgi:NO-binding membrane sensor protein with MHYT domain